MFLRNTNSFIKSVYDLFSRNELSSDNLTIPIKIPEEDVKKAFSMFSSIDDVISCLSLDLKHRFKFLTYALPYLTNNNTSEIDKKILSANVVKSLIVTIINTPEKILPDQYSFFISSYCQALKHVSVPVNISEQFIELFMEGFSDLEIIPYLSSFTLLFHEQPAILEESSVCCFSVLEYVLKLTTPSLEPNNQQIILDFIRVLFPQIKQAKPKQLKKISKHAANVFLKMPLQSKYIEEFYDLVFHLLIYTLPKRDPLLVLDVLDAIAMHPKMITFSHVNIDNEYSDIPCVPIWGFHNVPDTESKSPDLRINEVLEVETTFKHPIVKCVMHLLQSNFFNKFQIFAEFVVKALKTTSQINDDSKIFMHIIVSLVISQIFVMQAPLVEYFNNNNIWHIFFDHNLFISPENIFNSPNSDVVLIRKMFFNTLGNLLSFSKDLTQVRDCFRSLLTKNIKNSPIFSEIILLTYPKYKNLYLLDVNDNLHDILLQGLLALQQHHILGDNLSQIYRQITAEKILDIFSNEAMVAKAASSKFSTDALISSLFEEKLRLISLETIERLIIVSSFQKSKYNIVNALHSMFMGLSPKCKTKAGVDMLLSVATIIKSALRKDPIAISDLFLNSPIITDLIGACLQLPSDDSSLLVLDTLLSIIVTFQKSVHYDPESFSFRNLAALMNSIGISNQTFSLIRDTAIDKSGEIARITHPEALTLLITSVKNTEKYPEVLSMIASLCASSQCNRCACVVGEVPSMLMEYVSESTEEETMSIFEEISVTASSLRSLISFIEHFSDLSRKGMNAHVIPAVDTLTRIVEKVGSADQFSLLQFSSSTTFIELPSIKKEDVTEGLFYQAHLLIDATPGTRTLFEFGNSGGRLAMVYKRPKLKVAIIGSSDGSVFENTMAIDLPEGKFFKLSIVIAFGDCISIFINGVFTKGMPIPGICFNNMDMDSNHVFRATSKDSVQIQLRRLVISSLLTKIEDRSAYPTDIRTLIEIQASSFVQKGSVLVETESGTSIAAKFNGVQIPFYSNFMKIFESSHSIQFVLTLFGQAGLEDAMKAHLFEKLIKLLSAIFFRSLECISQVVDSEGFSVISYFIASMPSYYITVDFFNLFINMYTSIQGDDHRLVFCKNILFNLDVFKNCSNKVRCTQVDTMLTLCPSCPRITREVVKIPSIMRHIFDINEPLEESPLKKLLIDLVYISISVQLDLDQIHSIYVSCIACPELPVTLQCMLVCRGLCDNFIMDTEWCGMFLHPNEEVRTNMLDLFISTEHQNPLFDVHIALYCLASTAGITGNDDKMLLTSLRLALGVSQIKSNITMLIINPIPLFFGFVTIFKASEEGSKLFVETFKDIIKIKNNLLLIKKSLSPLVTYVMLSFILAFAPEVISELVILFMDSPESLRSAINTMDLIEYINHCDISIPRAAFLEEAYMYLGAPRNRNGNFSNCEYYEVIAQSLIFQLKIYSRQSAFEAYVENIENPFGFVINDTNTIENKFDIFRSIFKLGDSKFQVRYIFGIRYGQDGKWIESGVARNLLFGGMAIFVETEQAPPWWVYILIVIFFRINLLSEPIGSFSPLLSQALKTTPKDSAGFSMLIGCLQRRMINIEDDSYISSLIHDQYKRDIEDMRHTQVLLQTLLDLENSAPSDMSSLIQTLGDIVRTIKKRYNQFTLPASPDATTDFAKLIRRYVMYNPDLSEHHWKRLWQSLSYSNSPFLKKAGPKIHFKRGNIIGASFCPVLLQRNTNFNQHLEASKLTEEAAGEEIPDDGELPAHFTFRHERRESIHQKIYINQLWSAEADLIRVNGQRSGTFYVSSDGYLFISQDGKKVSIQRNSIRYIFWQRVMQRPTAIEIFTRERSYYFNFPQLASRSPIIKHVLNQHFENAIFIQRREGKVEIENLGLTQKWVERKISTFSYLMWLNQLSCRSFNSTHSYPVFPWILADYESHELDLSNPKTFRDLTKPVGALNEARLQKILDINSDDPSPEVVLFRSTYSCAFHVYYFLLRLEPYTTQHIEVQDGRFDVPSRLFSSMKGAWQSASGLTNNYKELIPEFFFLPDFLRNPDRFRLGRLTNGEAVDDVVLPPWAQSAEEFVIKHRRALESDHVSANINAWIDLIWGCDQTGEGARKRYNVFERSLYEDTWQRLNIDSTIKDETEALLFHVGQIPHKLFDAPHPARNPKAPLIKSDSLTATPYSRPVIAIRHCQSAIYTLHDDSSVFAIKITQAMAHAPSLDSVPISKKRIYRRILSAAPSSLYSSAPSLLGIGGSEGLFVFVSPNSREIVYISSDGNVKVIESSHHIDAVTSVCSIGDLVFTGGRDGLTCELTNNRSSMVHKCPVACCAASDENDIFVSCSTDGVMSIAIAHTLRFVRSVEMELPGNTQAHQVCITEGAGALIIVSSGHASDKSLFPLSSTISVFSLNGKKIAEESIAASAIEAVTTRDGENVIFIGSQENTVLLYRVVPLKLVEVVGRFDSRITTISYARDISILHVGTAAGGLTVMRIEI